MLRSGRSFEPCTKTMVRRAGLCCLQLPNPIAIFDSKAPRSITGSGPLLCRDRNLLRLRGHGCLFFFLPNTILCAFRGSPLSFRAATLWRSSWIVQYSKHFWIAFPQPSRMVLLTATSPSFADFVGVLIPVLVRPHGLRHGKADRESLRE